VLFLVLGMGWGGDRSRPGGNKPGRKPSMDAESIAKRAERQASKARTAQRKAAKAAAAVVTEQSEKQKAVMREKHAEQASCVRRQWGSERIADKAAAAALAGSAPEAAAPAAAAAQPKEVTLHSFFVKAHA